MCILNNKLSDVENTPSSYKTVPITECTGCKALDVKITNLQAFMSTQNTAVMTALADQKVVISKLVRQDAASSSIKSSFPVLCAEDLARMDDRVVPENRNLFIGNSRIYLYEAVCRLMAGVSPGPTQQLLDRSFHQRVQRSSGICGGKDKRNCHDGCSRERASAIYIACKYLPEVLVCSSGERAGMLIEAAKALKRIGDKRKLKDCYKLIKLFDGAIEAN